jgi:hypothetical protein
LTAARSPGHHLHRAAGPSVNRRAFIRLIVTAAKLTTLIRSNALAAKYADTMKVQVDLVYRDHLLQQPELVYADEPVNSPSWQRPVDSLGLLVLEPDGAIVPVAFGFSRRYQVCNVRNERLADAWPKYLQNGYPAFRWLCRRVWLDLARPNAPILCNWHELIVAHSHTPQPTVACDIAGTA